MVCFWDSGLNATFSLAELTLHPPVLHPSQSIGYMVDDAKAIHDPKDRNFSYIFNVCGSTNGPPPESMLDVPCDHVGPQVSGWQIGVLPRNPPLPPWRECYAIGLASNMRWSLLDGDDPAAGVQLTYGTMHASLNSSILHLLQKPLYFR
jgi:hypothetical protein